MTQDRPSTPPASPDAPAVDDDTPTAVDDAVTEADEAVTETDGAATESDDEEAWGCQMLQLPQERLELLQFMLGDVKESADNLQTLVAELADPNTREEACFSLQRTGEEVAMLAETFGFKSLQVLGGLLADAGPKAGRIESRLFSELTVRIRGIASLLEQHLSALQVGMEMSWPLDRLANRVRLVCDNHPLHPAIVGWHAGDADRLLELDGVIEGVDEPPVPETDHDPERVSEADLAAGADEATTGEAGEESARETIRVEVTKLRDLLSLCSQLALGKNRLLHISGRVHADQAVCADDARALGEIAGGLSRLSAELQIGAMATLTQPIARLLERYPRIVRDVAHIDDKEVEVELVGGDHEVERAIADRLAEPLNHVIRRCVRERIEKPEDREASGKPKVASIRLATYYLGSHLLVTVDDDGRGTPGEGSAFAQAVPEAAREPLASLGVRTTVGPRPDGEPGTRVELAVPLTMTVMPAMMLAVGDNTYALPIGSVAEVQRAKPEQVHTTRGRPFLRCREELLGLVDLREGFGDAKPAGEVAPIVVIIEAGERRAGLVVDEVIGQEDVVIWPLGVKSTDAAPFCGAVVRHDGRVGMIIDLARLVDHHLGGEQPAARLAA